MSFILEHHRLFNVAIEEDGSGDGLDGFVFLPSKDTQQRMKDHQLLFRSVEEDGSGEHGFEVYYRTNPLAASPLLGQINQRARFSFFLFQQKISFISSKEHVRCTLE